ncbi:MAG: RIP metalloprotease RseP [Paludibacteraceae bacterium]|nr:RIP metalloprotease RseP [Paludibacteraceae bacterium]
MSTLVVILQFFLSLTILVVFHEFGHFLMAKLFKVRVEKFYLFFNPVFSLFKYKSKKSDTEYGIGWLPLGGYVKLAGMIDESLDQEQMKKDPQPWEFRTKPAWQRLLIMVMGVVFNFILALLIYTMIAFHYGDSFIPLKNMTEGMAFNEYAQKVGFRNGDILLRADSEELIRLDDKTIHLMMEAKTVWVLRDGKEVAINMPEDFAEKIIEGKSMFLDVNYPYVIDSVMPESRAMRAGLMRGDSIVSYIDASCVDSVKKADVFSMVSMYDKCRNIPIPIIVSRNDTLTRLLLTPNEKGKIGVSMKGPAAFYKVEKVNYGLLESVSVGVKRGFGRLFSYVGDMKYVFSAAGAKSVGGFVSIGSLFPYPFNARIFWEITAFLSVILAFMNILPIPALDGGHVMFLVYEVITKKKPSQNVMVKAQIIGMILLFALMLYANLNDFRGL